MRSRADGQSVARESRRRSRPGQGLVRRLTPARGSLPGPRPLQLCSTRRAARPSSGGLAARPGPSRALPEWKEQVANDMQGRLARSSGPGVPGMGALPTAGPAGALPTAAASEGSTEPAGGCLWDPPGPAVSGIGGCQDRTRRRAARRRNGRRTRRQRGGLQPGQSPSPVPFPGSLLDPALW